jgi:hypothetical protein
MRHLGTVGLLALSTLGLSACDTTPPTFTVQPDAAFAVGTQLDDSDFANGDVEDDYTSPVYRRLTWEATDDDPACALKFDVLEWPSGDEPHLIEENLTATELDVWHTDYDGTYGGGSQTPGGWDIIAKDCAGNTTTVGVGEDGEPWVGSNVWQETGENVLTREFYTHPVSWTGFWRPSIGAWASGGQAQFTSERGASVSFSHRFDEGDHIGLVMPKGPGRGSAEVFVDDVKVATVDTYAPANDNRRIVFDQRVTAGTHTLKVVNLATDGHARIDVDAFLTDGWGL